MGLWSATSIGVGAMIGAGMFALIGIAADIAGRFAYLSFAFAGIVALLTTYSVSKLAVTYPSKGGRVEYLNRAFGRGLFSGSLNTIMWVGYIIVTSLYARAFGEYSLALLGSENELLLHLFTSSIIILFVGINFIGASVVGSSELLIVAVKVLVLVFFGVIGLSTADFSAITQTNGFDLGGIILASGVVFMSYEGFGLVANTAEDIENPAKNLPRALYMSVIIAIIVYVMVCLAAFGNMSPRQIIDAKEYALAEAARPIMGQLGFTLMGVAALFSTSSAINATIYGPVNMLQETSKAGQISSVLTRNLLNHDSGMALVITGAVILLVANVLNLEAIAETGSMIFLIIYVIVNVANLKLWDKTDSKAWPIWLGIAGTSLSFLGLAYYQLLQESLSLYMLIAIIAAGFIHQWLYQKYTPGQPKL